MRAFFVLVSLAFLVAITQAGKPTPPPPPPPPAGSANIRIEAFNVLAPTWAHPSYYPAACAPLLTPPLTRVGRGITYVQDHMLDTDFLAYQESETTINSVLDGGLGANYLKYHVFHDNDYWASWITVDPPFNPNGVSVAVNSNKYDSCSFHDRELGTGNHAAVAVCRNIAINRWFRFASVHFDSDFSSRRSTESSTLVAWLNSDTSREYVDIIAGDYNADTVSGVMKNNIINAGFVDVLRAVGVAENTSPWTGSGQNIDHLCVRGLRTTPVSGLVHSNDLWNLYPVQSGPTGAAITDQRITRHMEITGSDHFPVEAVFNAQS